MDHKLVNHNLKILALTFWMLSHISPANSEPYIFDKDILLSSAQDRYRSVSSIKVIENRLFIKSKSASKGDAVEIIDLSSGKLLASLSHPEMGKIKWIEFGHSIDVNERFIAISAYTESHYSGPRRQGEIHIYDANTFAHVKEFRSPDTERAFGFAEGLITLSGNHLFSSDLVYNSDRAVSIDHFNLIDGQYIQTLRDPEYSEGGLFGVGSNLGNPRFASRLLSNKTHIAFNTGEKMTAPTLYNIKTGEYSSPFKIPDAIKLNEFGSLLGIDEQYMVVGGSVNSNVVAGFGLRASKPMIFVYSLKTGELACSINDPFPVKSGTEPAALAAAKGLPTPYYGSGFGATISLSADLIVSGMDAYSETATQAGALAVLNKKNCEMQQIIESPKPEENTNFGLYCHSSETHLVVADSQQDKVSAFKLTSENSNE